MASTTHDERPQLPDELDLDLVALARSGPGPYMITAELPAAWLAQTLAHTDAEVTHAGAAALQVTAIGEGSSYLVRGSLEAGYSVPCARCLAPAPVAAGSEVCVHYVRDRREVDADEWDEATDADSPDERSFTGTHLDLRPLVEEQILVSYPMRALCVHGESCRGLCMHCGADLNAQKSGGPCEVCGAADAQVQLAAEVPEDEAEPPEADKPETPWKAALRQLVEGGGPKAGGSGRKRR